MNNKLFVKRYIVMIVVIVLVGAVFFARLINLQIINGADYEVMALKKSVNSTIVKAPRGEILDRYGRPLVTNRMAFHVVIDKMRLGKNDLNTLIFHLVEIFDKNEVDYTDSLQIGRASCRERVLRLV